MAHERERPTDGLTRSQRKELRATSEYSAYLTWANSIAPRFRTLARYRADIQIRAYREEREEIRDTRAVVECLREDTRNNRGIVGFSKCAVSGMVDEHSGPTREGDEVNANRHLNTLIRRTMRDARVRQDVEPVLLMEEVLSLIQAVKEGQG